MNVSLETMKSRGFSMISGDVIQLLKMDTLQIPPKALIRSPRPLEWGWDWLYLGIIVG